MAVTRQSPVPPLPTTGNEDFATEVPGTRSAIQTGPATPDTTLKSGMVKDGYYGIPMLKRPTWGWEVAWYFFLGGISAGSFTLASLANLAGRIERRRLQSLIRAGYSTAFIFFLPCPPLLIADLGDPSRFHHMLRVFKPTSPMNLGVWALIAYSFPLTLLGSIPMGVAVMEWPRAPKFLPKFLPKSLKVLGQSLPPRFLSILGIGPALTMLSYPGVLLSTTSTPLWSQSRCLGALFACSSLANAVSATSLMLVLRGRDHRESLRRLDRIEKVVRVAEIIALGSYLVTSRKAVKRLVQGRHGWSFWMGAVGVGLLLPGLVRPKASGRRPGLKSILLRSAVSLAALAGGLALKWSVTQAGKDSAEDAEISREVTRPSRSAPGWGPG